MLIVYELKSPLISDIFRLQPYPVLIDKALRPHSSPLSRAFRQARFVGKAQLHDSIHAVVSPQRSPTGNGLFHPQPPALSLIKPLQSPSEQTQPHLPMPPPNPLSYVPSPSLPHLTTSTSLTTHPQPFPPAPRLRHPPRRGGHVVYRLPAPGPEGRSCNRAS